MSSSLYLKAWGWKAVLAFPCISFLCLLNFESCGSTASFKIYTIISLARKKKKISSNPDFALQSLALPSGETDKRRTLKQ